MKWFLRVAAMATMRTQTVVLVSVRFPDGSLGWGEGTTIGGLSYGAESPGRIRSAINGFMAMRKRSAPPLASAAE